MERKETLEAGALAIKSLGVIEQAYRFVDETLNVEFYLAVEQAIKKALPTEGWDASLSESKEKSVDYAWFTKADWKDRKRQSKGLNGQTIFIEPTDVEIMGQQSPAFVIISASR